MALFKINKGNELDSNGKSRLPSDIHEGWAYVSEDEGNLYVDVNATKRVKIGESMVNNMADTLKKDYIQNITLQLSGLTPYYQLKKGNQSVSNLEIPVADATTAGIILPTEQDIGGDKTFKKNIWVKGSADIVDLVAGNLLVNGGARFVNVINGTIVNAQNADKATADASDQNIQATYIKNAAWTASPTAPQLQFTKGDNKVFNVDVPPASATTAGVITNGTQTLSGAKTIDTNGSLIIQKANGFRYSGIENAGGDNERRVWIETSAKNGTPCLTAMTYNPAQNRLTVGSITGSANSATYDSGDNPINTTYIKAISFSTNGVNLTYTKGNNGTTDVLLPVASATSNGTITTGTQTITGAKTIDANGSLEIKKGSGFNYSGIRAGTIDASRVVWFADNTAKGKPVYNDNFTYNPVTATLNVTNVNGQAASAIKDSGDNTINTTYIKEVSFSTNGTQIIAKKGNNSTSNINLPVAGKDTAGVITNAAQSIYGAKSFQSNVSVTGSVTASTQLISNQATGTAPLSVKSTTLVTNLNADMVDGMHASNDTFTAAAAKNNTLPTQLAVFNSMNSLLDATKALVYKGVVAATAAPTSAPSIGDVYVVSTAGNLNTGYGYGSNYYSRKGDMIICQDITKDSSGKITSVTWDILETDMDGAVLIKGGDNPSTTATLNSVPRFDDSHGKVIKDSKITIDDNGHMNPLETNKQNLGSSNLKYANVYATTFQGNLNGLAAKATADGNNQSIVDTYIKSITLTDHASSPKYNVQKGKGTTSDLAIPVASTTSAGVITAANQILAGQKTFNGAIVPAGGIKFPTIGTWPAVSGETYPIDSTRISWGGSSDGAAIYYEIQAVDKGMLVIEATDDANAGAVFRNKSTGKTITMLDGTVYGNLDGTATKATNDAGGQNIKSTYLSKGAMNGYVIQLYDGNNNVKNELKPNFAGSASNGGSALSAVKLDTSAGSADTPVYFNGGKPVAVGTIATAHGGTGLNSYTANRLLYTETTSKIGQAHYASGTQIAIATTTKPDNMYAFEVSGRSSLAGDVRIKAGYSETKSCTLSYNKTNDCLEFIFA